MINYKGLRKRQTYDELVDFIETDPDRIHYPDRRATQLRESPYLTQLDGEGMRQMDSLEANRMKEPQKLHVLKQMASSSGLSIAELGASQTQQPHGIPVDQIFHEPQQPEASECGGE